MDDHALLIPLIWILLRRHCKNDNRNKVLEEEQGEEGGR